MKRKVVVLLVVGAAIAVVVVAGGKVRTSERRKVVPAGGDAIPEIVAPGRVEGRDRTFGLAFEQAGRVVALPVKEGQRVAKGELLAALDDRIAKARLAQAEAAVMSAGARRDLAFKGSRVGELRAAEADLEAARAQARSQSLEQGRATRLAKQNAIAAAESDRIEAAADSSSAQVSAAEARLSMLREGTRGELKRAAIADLAAAEATVEEAKALLSQTRLTAPCDGIIIRRFVSEGELVSLVPPTVVFSIADISRLRLRAEIDEEDIAKVTVGQRGYTTAAGFEAKRFSGRIVERMRDIGRKGVRNEDDPRARVDTRILEVLFEFDLAPSLPIGLRMDLHVPLSGHAGDE